MTSSTHGTDNLSILVEFPVVESTTPKTSVASTIGAGIASAVQKVKSLFTKNPDDTQNEPTPRATFDEFLSAKAGKGFTTTDKLAVRGIELITAEGGWNKIKAFFALGGIGFFFAEKVTGENKEALIQEARFYRECCKVQDFYNAFNKKPDAANFKGLQTAYEAVLAMGESSAQHNTINLILNKHFAKDSPVGEAILSHEAKTSLTSMGGFNEESIMETITGSQFLGDIQAKSEMGYRGRDLTKDEDSVVNNADETLIKQNEIKAILADKSTRSIFLSYARVFNQLRDFKKAHAICTEVVKTLSKGTVSDAQVERRVADYNALLLDLVKNPEKPASTSALPQVAQDALDEMRKLYQEHEENLVLQKELMVDHQTALDAQKKAGAALTKEGAKTRSCTLAELETVFGENPNEQLPGAREYKDVITKKKELEERLTAKSQNIETKKAELEELVGKNGSLIAKEKELAGTLAEQDTIMSAKAAELEKYNGAKELAKKIRNKESLEDSKQEDYIKQVKAESIQALRTYTSAEAEHKEVKEKIAKAKAELALLNKNSDKSEIIKERDDVAKELAEVNAKRFDLTHAQITTIFSDDSIPQGNGALSSISLEVQKLRETKEDIDNISSHLDGEINEKLAAITKSSKALRDFGFEVSDDGVVGALNFAGFDTNFKESIGPKMIEQGRLSANIVAALQVVAADPKEMNNNVIYDRSTHARVDISQIAPGAVSINTQNTSSADFSDLVPIDMN